MVVSDETHNKSFLDGRRIEDIGLDILIPIITSDFGFYVMTLPEKLQKYGDLHIAKDIRGPSYTVELKVDTTPITNIFFETWSNRSIKREGWIIYLHKADYFWYYFIEQGKLYHIKTEPLLHHLLELGKLYNYDEKPQLKREQKNDAWGRPVPVKHLQEWLGEDMQEFIIDKVKVNK